MAKFDPSMQLDRNGMIELLIASKFSLGDQIGILRKKLANPEDPEFDTFNSYVNTVKQQATEEFEVLTAEDGDGEGPEHGDGAEPHVDPAG